MGDAAEFMMVLLERFGVEGCALEDFDAATSRSILYELFGFWLHCEVAPTLSR